MRGATRNRLGEGYTLCEVLIKYIMPPARAMLARILSSEYGLSQLEISKILGVSQPLINYYLTGKRRVRGEEELASVKGFKNVLREVASMLARSYKAGSKIPPPLCAICRLLRTSGTLNEVLRRLGLSEDSIKVPDLVALKQ